MAKYIVVKEVKAITESSPPKSITIPIKTILDGEEKKVNWMGNSVNGISFTYNDTKLVAPLFLGKIIYIKSYDVIEEGADILNYPSTKKYKLLKNIYDGRVPTPLLVIKKGTIIEAEEGIGIGTNKRYIKFIYDGVLYNANEGEYELADNNIITQTTSILTAQNALIFISVALAIYGVYTIFKK